MKHFICSLASVTPYCQSRNFDMELKRGAKENADEFERKNWRLRTHINDDGQIIIPEDALQFAIREASGYLSERIPGKGAQTWTKHFRSGILVPEHHHTTRHIRPRFGGANVFLRSRLLSHQHVA